MAMAHAATHDIYEYIIFVIIASVISVAYLNGVHT